MVLTVSGEGFSVQARIVIKMKKTPQPQELKGIAVIIVPVEGSELRLGGQKDL